MPPSHVAIHVAVRTHCYRHQWTVQQAKARIYAALRSPAYTRKQPGRKRTFDGLSYSLQNYHVQQVEGAKTPETRQRRIEKSIATLHEGKPH